MSVRIQGGHTQVGMNIVTDGLVLYLDAANQNSYPRNGSVWTDLSGAGNNATLNSTYVTWTNENSGIMVFSGDGTNSQGCIITNGGALINSYESTIEALVFVPSSKNSLIFHSDNGSFNQWAIMDGDKVSLNSAQMTVNSNGGVWNHLIFTTHVPGLLFPFSYVNGNFTNADAAIGFYGMPSTHWWIGCSPNPFTQDFKLSFLRSYNRILTQSEITQNFNASKYRVGL
jgi:hypothetical protein